MAKNTVPADKDYVALDGHRYTNAPRWSAYTQEWWFSSAYAVHSNECDCFTDPEFSH